MTIAEVSKKYGLSADTLRYYERIGLIPGVRRKENGIRDYSESDCNWVEFIKCMRAAGIQVEALIEYVALFQQGDDTQEARNKFCWSSANSSLPAWKTCSGRSLASTKKSPITMNACVSRKKNCGNTTHLNKKTATGVAVFLFATAQL